MQLSSREIEKMLEGLVETKETKGNKIKKVSFDRLKPVPQDEEEKIELEYLQDIQVVLQAELAQTTFPLRKALTLKEGDIISLDKLSGEPADVYLNGHPFARGEVLVINEVFGIRIQEVLPPEENHDF